MSAGASIQDLVRSISLNTSDDAFAPALTPQQWEILGNYMQPFELLAGQALIERGALDQTLFFVESGALSVHVMNKAGQVRMIILNPGAVVGEGAFFSHLPRVATAAATGACRMWRMSAIRFLEMAQRQPGLTLEFTLALGAVIARRMANRSRRVAVT